MGYAAKCYFPEMGTKNDKTPHKLTHGTAVTCQAALCWTDVADAEVFIAVNVFGTQVTGGHTSWSTNKTQQIPLFIPIPLHPLHIPLEISSIRHRGGIGLMLVPTESKFLKFVKVPRNMKGD